MSIIEVMIAIRRKLKVWRKATTRYLFERVESDCDVAPETAYVANLTRVFLGRS